MGVIVVLHSSATWNRHILITVQSPFLCHSLWVVWIFCSRLLYQSQVEMQALSSWPYSSCSSSPQAVHRWWRLLMATPRTTWAASSPWRWAPAMTTRSSPAPSTTPLFLRGTRGASRLCGCCVSQLGNWGGRKAATEATQGWVRSSGKPQTALFLYFYPDLFFYWAE